MSRLDEGSGSAESYTGTQEETGYLGNIGLAGERAVSWLDQKQDSELDQKQVVL